MDLEGLALAVLLFISAMVENSQQRLINCRFLDSHTNFHEWITRYLIAHVRVTFSPYILASTFNCCCEKSRTLAAREVLRKYLFFGEVMRRVWKRRACKQESWRNCAKAIYTCPTIFIRIGENVAPLGRLIKYCSIIHFIPNFRNVYVTIISFLLAFGLFRRLITCASCDQMQ